MSDKILKTRIKQKTDTKANWDKAVNFVPLKGEYIYYSDINRVKVGDGAKKVGELPFLADSDTHQPIKSLNTSNTAAQTPSSSEAIAGSGTINLHKVAKTGSYNDLNNKPTIPTVNNGQLTIQKNGTAVATFTANQSGNATANITVPTKLADLSDRTFSNITSRGEEYLDWGGTSHSGSVSPIGMCLSAEHSANRVALINPDALTFEYSSDGGTTWTAYSYAGADKTKFCTTSLSLPIGRPNNSTNLVANKSKTRITITAQNGTKEYVYTSLKKMLVQVSTATALSLLVETRTGTNYKNNGAWSSVGTYNLSGWSGWNDIPTLFSLGGGTTQTSNNWQMRLTITCTTVSSSYPKTAEVLGIRLFGDNCWTQASTLAGTGNIYTYDMSGNVTFPNDLYVAKQFTVGGSALLKSGKQTTTSTVDGGSNIYTFTDTKGATSTFTVKNGSKGSTGPQGPQGPQGERGPQGNPGAAGAHISSVTGDKTPAAGNTVTYTMENSDGSTAGTFKVVNGTNGSNGSNGHDGAAAGFGTPTASVDANVGTPSVTVTASGSNTSKVFDFAFKNLKGQKGDTGATGSVADLTVSGTGNAIANISLNKSTKKITATKGNFVPMTGTGTTPITSDLYMKGRYDRTISSSGLVPEGGGSVGSKPAYSEAYYGLKGICYSYYSDDSTYGATSNASSTTNYQGFCYNPLEGSSQRYNQFQLYTLSGLSVYKWISQNGKGPNYNSMDWSSFRCSTINSNGELKYYDGSDTYTKTIKNLMEKMEIKAIDGTGYSTYGYVKDDATGLMICYGTTGQVNGAGVSVTFSATFKGAPTVVVVPYVKSLSETSIVSQYRNSATIRCYIDSAGSRVNSTGNSSAIKGFTLDTGNGEYQYFNYIAIGQYK